MERPTSVWYVSLLSILSFDDGTKYTSSSCAYVPSVLKHRAVNNSDFFILFLFLVKVQSARFCNGFAREVANQGAAYLRFMQR